MLTIKLAFRNIAGAGLRTWLNVFVLSIAFVAILWIQGLINGQVKQIMNLMIDTELGGGQFWHNAYEPYDPLTLEDAHAPIAPALANLVDKKMATPIFITSGAIYPDGRVQSSLIKGIDPQQQIIDVPAHTLKSDNEYVIPALIGTRMARQTKMMLGDYVTIRWRDIHGTFDAADIQIVYVMNTNSPVIDMGQIWIPLDKMQKMLLAPGEATLVVLDKKITSVPAGTDEWIHRDLDFLLKDVRQILKTKTASSSILYALLMAMALLAIFDTQVLSIFRRRKEMGTLMALGMTRGGVIKLFTLEGALHGILALIIGAVYGIPLMYLTASKGLPPPSDAIAPMGVAMPSVLYPSYSIWLIGGTTLLVFITTTVVSFLPTRKIAKLKPTDALRGKLS
jgi:ABC-type lipoprotein release transport system permease subunit